MTAVPRPRQRVRGRRRLPGLPYPGPGSVSVAVGACRGGALSRRRSFGRTPASPPSGGQYGLVSGGCVGASVRSAAAGSRPMLSISIESIAAGAPARETCRAERVERPERRVSDARLMRNQSTLEEP